MSTSLPFDHCLVPAPFRKGVLCHNDVCNVCNAPNHNEEIEDNTVQPAAEHTQDLTEDSTEDVDNSWKDVKKFLGPTKADPTKRAPG